MFSLLLPLRAIVFQLLFLLVTISLESFVIEKHLDVPRKTSVDYAASINLIATVSGWLIFFYFEPHLPPVPQTVLMKFILFNEWSESTLILLFAFGFFTFFITLIIKIAGFELLEILAQTTAEEQQRRTLNDPKNFYKSSIKNFETTVVAVTLLRAHSYSHVVISLVLIAQLLQTKLP